MSKMPRFQPFETVLGSQLNMILDMLDGGQFTLQGGSAVSGSSAGGSGIGAPPPTSLGPAPVGGSNYPSTPSGLGGRSGIDLLSVVNNGFAQLSWNPNPTSEFVMEYDIQYRKGADSNYAFQKVPSGLTSVKISGLFPGYTYMFSIRAVNGANNSSPWSQEVPIGITADVSAPAVPTGLAAYATPHGAFLSWSSNTESDLQGYLLQYSLNAGVTWVQINSIPALTGAMQWTNPNTPNNTNSNVSVQFRIAAADFSGNTSAYSSAVTATTGGLSFAELLVGNLTALGTITGAGGITTRTGGTGAGVDILQTGVAGYNSSNVRTFFLETTTGNFSALGTATVGGAANAVQITAGTIMTPDANVFTTGGAVMDGNGLQVRAKGSSFVPAGTTTWFANVNGQFLSAQYYPVYTGYTPVDASNPATARFQITGDITRLVSVKVSFYCDTFKVGQQNTATGSTSGGTSAGHTHNVSGQTALATTSGGSGHVHGIQIGSGTGQQVFESFGGLYAASASAVSTDQEAGPHTHGVPNMAVTGVASGGQSADHTHGIPNLAVQAPTGLYNTGGASGVHIKIFNAAGTLIVDLGPFTGGAGVFVTDQDITSYITSTGWWQVQFTSATLGGIEGQVNIKAIVQAI